MNNFQKLPIQNGSFTKVALRLQNMVGAEYGATEALKAQACAAHFPMDQGEIRKKS